jgi:hypothetical protein
MHKSKYLAIHANKCGRQDSLGIDYHWCGNGQGGTPNIELQFDTTTGKLIGVVFIPEGAQWGDTPNAELRGRPLADGPA